MCLDPNGPYSFVAFVAFVTLGAVVSWLAYKSEQKPRREILPGVRFYAELSNGDITYIGSLDALIIYLRTAQGGRDHNLWELNVHIKRPTWMSTDGG